MSEDGVPSRTGSTSDGYFERAGLRRPTEDVIGIEHLVEGEVVTDESLTFDLVRGDEP
jgi:hypothetical protein